MSDDYQYSNRVILEDESEYKKKRFMRLGLFLVAIVALVFTCNHFKSDEMIVYNGFSQNVSVQVGEDSYFIAPERFMEVDIKLKDSVTVIATIDGDTIDNFIPSHLEDGDNYIYNVGHAAAFYEYEVIYTDASYGNMFGNNLEADSKIIGAPRWFSSNADYVLVEAPEEIEISKNSHSARKWQLDVVSDLSPRGSLGWMLEGAENISEMLTANAMYSSADDPQLVDWITYSAYMDPDMAAVKKRLERNPSEVASMRALMDSGSEEDKKSSCERVASQVSANPMDADLQYLNCRCMEDETEKDQAFMAAYEKWPNNGWLSYAAGHVYSAQEKWDEAMDAYAKAMTLQPSSTNAYLMQINRLKRHTQKGGFPGAYLFDYDEDIKYVNALRTGNSEEFYEDADGFYSLIRLQKYKSAKLLLANSSDADYQKLLFDLSRNATDDFHQEIMNSDAYMDADGDMFFMAAAFSAKHGVDLSKGTNWSYALEDLEIDEEAFGKYLSALKSKSMSQVSNTIKGLTDNFVIKVKLKNMARIVLGESIPESWKNETTNMLYVNEKPVF